jgi:hypothetical protein
LVAEDAVFFAKALGDRDFSKVPITDIETHLLHCLGGISLVFFLNNVAAIFVENAHYRGMAVFLQMIFFIVDGYSYNVMGKEVAPAVLVSVGVGAVGLAVHAMEPGIFTKDKDSGKKNK